MKTYNEVEVSLQTSKRCDPDYFSKDLTSYTYIHPQYSINIEVFFMIRGFEMIYISLCYENILILLRKYYHTIHKSK